MRELISKELLSLVLGINNISGIYEITDNELNYATYADITQGMRDYDLNLDTLGRLCKEWCYDLNSIILTSGRYSYDKFFASKDNQNCIGFGETELEAIINATEYIANEKGLV